MNELEFFKWEDSLILENGYALLAHYSGKLIELEEDTSISILTLQENLNVPISSYPKGQFMELDAVTLNTEEKFEGIYSNKVLHHLSDQELIASTERQADVLSSGGITCHSFWKGDGSEIFKGLFVNYHSEDSLIDVFGKHFEILVIDTYSEFEDGDSLLLIGKK